MIESTIEAVVYNPSVALYGVLGLIILVCQAFGRFIWAYN
jgi:hypothetical protein